MKPIKKQKKWGTGKKAAKQPQLTDTGPAIKMSKKYIEKILIYPDGGVNGNGYIGSVGAYAFVVTENEEVLHQYSRRVEETTNNRMEMQACIDAMYWVKEQGITEPVRILSDSEYCVKGYNIWSKNWKPRGWAKIANDDLWKEIDSIGESLPNVEISWIKGHSGIYHNEMADALCTAAITGKEPIIEPKKEKLTATEIVIDRIKESKGPITISLNTAHRANELLLLVYREWYKDGFNLNGSHGLMDNIKEYLEEAKLIDKPEEL